MKRWVPGALVLLLGSWAVPANAEAEAIAPALREAICGRRLCELERVGRLRAPYGAPNAEVIKWSLCADGVNVDPDQLRDGVCARAYFRAVWRTADRPEVQMLIVDGNRGRYGYGAGGGDEAVTLDVEKNTLNLAIQGGDSGRWHSSQLWKLWPSVSLLSFTNGYGVSWNPDWSLDFAWSAQDDVWRGSAARSACRLDTVTRQWVQPDRYDADSPTLAAQFANLPSASEKEFDWRKQPLPNWLELRADAQAGWRRQSFVVTRSRPPVTPLAVRLLWLSPGTVIVEWRGLEEARRAGQKPRLEAWLWTRPIDGKEDCVIAPKQANPDEEFPENVRPISEVFQVLIDPSGVVTPAFWPPSGRGPGRGGDLSNGGWRSAMAPDLAASTGLKRGCIRIPLCICPEHAGRTPAAPCEPCGPAPW